MNILIYNDKLVVIIYLSRLGQVNKLSADSHSIVILILYLNIYGAISQ